MATKADWQVVPRSIADEPATPMFFSEHEWATIEAATARIYPSDHAPGALEAKAVRFIDRYLSGIDYIFASADGSGFLRIGGKDADAWRLRIHTLQQKYRAGISQIDDIAQQTFGARFRHIDQDQQDAVLEIVSGAPKPTAVRVAASGEAHVQNIADDALDFFSALALHTRQGTFCDPVYGGNAGRAGWDAIGFPGPQSLLATQDCTYGHKDKFLTDFDWADLIPHLRTAAD